LATLEVSKSVEEMVDPLQKVNVHLTIWTAGRRYWRKLE
jgi:hypothetical protein